MKKSLIILAVLFALGLSSCGNVSTMATHPEDLPATTSQGTPINYHFDLSGLDWQETPESTCFSEIAYDEDANILVVVFRERGTLYAYYDISDEVWQDLCAAKSKGGYYNDNIKGEFYCEKIN